MSLTAEPPRATQSALPNIGVWWPMLEPDLQREVLENPSSPLRRAVVVRIFELCEVHGMPGIEPVRLSTNERAYLAGWTHRPEWE